MHTEMLADCPLCRRAADLDDDGVPVGVKERELYSKEDWRELVRVRERQLERHADDIHVRLALAEAHLLAGEPERALEVAAACHAEEPDDPWIEDTVLEALFALGKTERDFPWRGETPAILRLDAELLDRVHGRVTADPELEDVALLYHVLAEEAFTPFGPEELLTALREHPRFVTEADDGTPWQARVRAVPAGGDA